MLLFSLTIAAIVSRTEEFWQKITMSKEDFQAALIFFTLMAWISLGPSVSPARIIPFAEWLTYDRFVLYPLPLLALAIIEGPQFFFINDRKALGASRRISIRFVTFIILAILMAGIGTAIASRATYDWLGYAYGSTFDIPREVIDYFRNESSKGEWGRTLALGMPAYYQIIPDFTGVPLINIPYATARLLTFLRKSGAGDFAEAKFFPNGSFQIKHVLRNYDLYGVRWIILKDAYYEQFIPPGHFRLVLNVSNNAEEIHIYRAFTEIDFLGGDPTALYKPLFYTDFESTDSPQIGIGGGAQVATLDRNAAGIRLIVQTNKTWGWGFIILPLNLTNNFPYDDAFLLVKARSWSSSLLGIRVMNKLGAQALVENAYLSSEWMTLTFRLDFLMPNSTIFIGVAGNKLEEQLEIENVLVGVPRIYAKTITPGNIRIQKNDTLAITGLIVKEAYYPLWSTSEAKLSRSGDFLCLDIPKGVTYVTLRVDDRLYMLHIASGAAIVMVWCIDVTFLLLSSIRFSNKTLISRDMDG